MEDLIVHAAKLLDKPEITSSPPLPPAPVEDPVPAYTYGSAYTQVSSIQPGFENDSPGRTGTVDDFTPRLPTRPPSSIHPSRRANNSGSSSRTVMPVLEEDLLSESPRQSADSDLLTAKGFVPDSDARNSVLTLFLRTAA